MSWLESIVDPASSSWSHNARRRFGVAEHSGLRLEGVAHDTVKNRQARSGTSLHEAGLKCEPSLTRSCTFTKDRELGVIQVVTNL